MMDDLEFVRAVMMLRALHPQRQLLALHCALFWSSAEVVERACRVPLDDEVRGMLQ
jgi:hypothetical protein